MSFLNEIEHRVLVFDGAAYTPFYYTYDEFKKIALMNLNFPMDILDKHTAYVEAGADILSANTFQLNPIRLKSAKLEAHAEELIENGIALCKEASSSVSRRVFAAAVVGPSLLDIPSSPHQIHEELYKAFYYQCAVSESAGADIIYIAGMKYLAELRIALLAACSSTALPVICDCPIALVDIDIAALFAAKLGASAIGLCGIGETLNDNLMALKKTSSLPSFVRIPKSALSNDDIKNNINELVSLGTRIICVNDASPDDTKALAKIMQNGITVPVNCSGHLKQTYISAVEKLLPLNDMINNNTANNVELSLHELSFDDALAALIDKAKNAEYLQIDFANYDAETLTLLLHKAEPYLRKTPLVFHIHTAAQARAALFTHPGIVAVYAHSDAYRVLKAAVRYGAEVIT